MTNKVLVFLLLMIISCGTLGHIVFYKFDESKLAVEKELLRIINEDSLYTPPLEWNDYKLGQDSLYDIFIYFKDTPKEIYLVRFTDRETWSHSNSSQLGLVGVFDGQFWYFEKDLNSKEESRLMKRFEVEILSKFPYSYKKEN